MVAQPFPLARRPHSPLSLTPSLFVGIDVGKKSHLAGFVSASLLAQRRFEQCPFMPVPNTRAGLVSLLERIQQYAPLSQCAVVMESTGHYHKALAERLMEHGITVYVVAIRSKRVNGQKKTDKYDALRLANSLYAQLVLDLQVTEKSQQARQLIAPTPEAAELRSLARRHHEMQQTLTRVRNRLTAINDELFPEFTEIFKDCNASVALGLRAAFPTPAAMASSRLEDMQAIRREMNSCVPSDARLERLRSLAKESIGVSNPVRVRSLTFEQDHLINGLRLARQQKEAIDAKIEALVRSCREGQILLSIPGVGPINAGSILGCIGNIRNFASAAALRKYCGWAPMETQTGTSVDRSTMNPTGSRIFKQAMYLTVMTAISQEQENAWSTLYQRLVPRMCSLDQRKKTYKGKMKVVGRVAGQMIGVIFSLLKQDAELVDTAPDGILPDPVLYDPDVHAGTKAR